MKKIFILLVSVLFIASPFKSNAQTFKNGDMVLNAGIGFGYSYGILTGASSWPAISLSLEKGFREIDNVGTLSLGGQFGFQHASWGAYNLSWNDFFIGGRCALHLGMIEVENLDVYGGVSLGLRIYTDPVWTYDVNTGWDYKSKGHVGPYFGIFAGARYYFTDKIGVFTELGYDVAYFKLGVSVKL